MNARLQDLREQNDNPYKTDVETALIRGRIAMVKEILAFPDEGNAGADATPDLLGSGTDGHEA